LRILLLIKGHKSIIPKNINKSLLKIRNINTNFIIGKNYEFKIENGQNGQKWPTLQIVDFSTTIFRRPIAKNIIQLGLFRQRLLTAKCLHFFGYRAIFLRKLLKWYFYSCFLSDFGSSAFKIKFFLSDYQLAVPDVRA